MLQTQCGSCHVCSQNGSLVQVPASQLIDKSRKLTAIRFWHDQIFSKPAHHGGVVAWSVHTDKQPTSHALNGGNVWCLLACRMHYICVCNKNDNALLVFIDGTKPFKYQNRIWNNFGGTRVYCIAGNFSCIFRTHANCAKIRTNAIFSRDYEITEFFFTWQLCIYYGAPIVPVNMVAVYHRFDGEKSMQHESKVRISPTCVAGGVA